MTCRYKSCALNFNRHRSQPHSPAFFSRCKSAYRTLWIQKKCRSNGVGTAYGIVKRILFIFGLAVWLLLLAHKRRSTGETSKEWNDIDNVIPRTHSHTHNRFIFGTSTWRLSYSCFLLFPRQTCTVCSRNGIRCDFVWLASTATAIVCHRIYVIFFSLFLQWQACCLT